MFPARSTVQKNSNTQVHFGCQKALSAESCAVYKQVLLAIFYSKYPRRNELLCSEYLVADTKNLNLRKKLVVHFHPKHAQEACIYSLQQAGECFEDAIYWIELHHTQIDVNNFLRKTLIKYGGHSKTLHQLLLKWIAYQSDDISNPFFVNEISGRIVRQKCKYFDEHFGAAHVDYARLLDEWRMKLNAEERFSFAYFLTTPIDCVLRSSQELLQSEAFLANVSCEWLFGTLSVLFETIFDAENDQKCQQSKALALIYRLAVCGCKKMQNFFAYCIDFCCACLEKNAFHWDSISEVLCLRLALFCLSQWPIATEINTLHFCNRILNLSAKILQNYLLCECFVLQASKFLQAINKMERTNLLHSFIKLIDEAKSTCEKMRFLIVHKQPQSLIVDCCTEQSHECVLYHKFYMANQNLAVVQQLSDGVLLAIDIFGKISVWNLTNYRSAYVIRPLCSISDNRRINGWLKKSHVQLVANTFADAEQLCIQKSSIATNCLHIIVDRNLGISTNSISGIHTRFNCAKSILLHAENSKYQLIKVCLESCHVFLYNPCEGKLFKCEKQLKTEEPLMKIAAELEICNCEYAVSDENIAFFVKDKYFCLYSVHLNDVIFRCITDFHWQCFEIGAWNKNDEISVLFYETEWKNKHDFVVNAISVADGKSSCVSFGLAERTAKILKVTSKFLFTEYEVISIYGKLIKSLYTFKHRMDKIFFIEQNESFLAVSYTSCIASIYRFKTT